MESLLTERLNLPKLAMSPAAFTIAAEISSEFTRTNNCRF